MMTDEQKALADQLRSIQRQQIEACQAEIEAALSKYHCVLTGVPQYVQNGNAWVTTIAVGVALAREDT